MDKKGDQKLKVQNEKLYRKLEDLFEPNWNSNEYAKINFILENIILTKHYRKKLEDKSIRAQFWIDIKKSPNRLDFELVHGEAPIDKVGQIVENLRKRFMEDGKPDFLEGSREGSYAKIVYTRLPEDLDRRSKIIRKFIKYLDKVIQEIEQENLISNNYSARVDHFHSALAEDGYFRESPEKFQEIILKHNILSNEFSKWLKNNGINCAQEENFIDVLFKHNQKNYIAELKIVYGVSTTKSIREAFGQLLEYNFYKGRFENDEWMIILDRKPVKDDKKYIDVLKEKLNFPIRLGWSTKKSFKFYPLWKI